MARRRQGIGSFFGPPRGPSSPRMAPADPSLPAPQAPPGIPSLAPAWTDQAVAGGDPAAGMAGYLAGQVRVLEAVYDYLGADIDDETAARMLRDPAIAGCIGLLMFGLSEHELTLRAAAMPEPGYEPGDDPATDAEMLVAQAVHDFDRAALDGLEEPIEDVLFRMAEFPATRAEAAEIVLKLTPDVPLGVGLGYTLQRIAPVPRDAWRYVADSAGNVSGFYCRTTAGGSRTPGFGWEVLPPAKFLALAWRPKPGDPSGRTILHAARGPWAVKNSHVPDLSKLLRRFGQPVVVGTAAPDTQGGATSAVARNIIGTLTDETPSGDRLTGMQRFFLALSRWVGGGILALRPGETAQILEPKTTGQALLGAMDWLDRQAVMGILMNARGLLEAKHDSRADTDSAGEQVDKIIRVMRRGAQRAVGWQVLWRLNAINFGTAIADAYTPAVSLSGSDEPDVAGMGSMWSGAGWSIAPEHFPEVDEKMGLTPRRRESADRQQTQDQGGQDGGDGQDQGDQTDGMDG